ncbi:MAG: NYN domain-containing protein [Minisyncoccia bacterium]
MVIQGDQNKKVYVFIDASNLWQAQKTKKKLFDNEKLARYLRKEFATSAMRVFYYTAYPQEGTRSYSLDSKHKFYTYLEKSLKFVVVKKPLKRITIHTSAGDIIEEKGNMDVEMSIDVMQYIHNYDIAVFFTGDSDFMSLINILKAKGKRVYVYSSKNNVSSELRTGADGYCDVLEIKDDIWGKDLSRRIIT